MVKSNMFNKEYYDSRKKDLEQEFTEKKDAVLTRLLNTFAEVNSELQKLQQKYQELLNKEKTAQELEVKELKENEPKQAEPVKQK